MRNIPTKINARKDYSLKIFLKHCLRKKVQGKLKNGFRQFKNLFTKEGSKHDTK